MNARLVVLVLDVVRALSALIRIRFIECPLVKFFKVFEWRFGSELKIPDGVQYIFNRLADSVRLSFIVSVLISLSIFGSLGLQAESEPNNILAQSNLISLNGNQTGQFDPSGEYDWFQFVCPGPGRFSLSVIDPPQNIRMEIVLYGRHAQWLSIYNSAVNSGDDVFLSADLVEPGTYFIRLRDLNSQVSDGSYTLTNEFTPTPDAYEPNGVIGDSSLIQSAFLQGIVFPGGDEDFYRVFVEDGGLVSFSLTPSEAMRGELVLYDSNMNWMSVYSTAVNDGDEVFLERTIGSAGFYYLRVRDLNNRSHLDNYDLATSGARVGYAPVETPTNAESEPNHDTGVAGLINLGGQVSGTIGENQDHDWYAFDVTQPSQIALSMDPSVETLVLRAEFFNGSKQHLLSAQSGAEGATFSMTYDFVRPGRYYLRVIDLNGRFSATPYKFTTTVTPVVDLFEPNGYYGDASPLNQVNQIQAYLFNTGDHDWYRVQVSEPGELIAILSNLPSNITPSLDVFDLSKQHLTGRSGAAGTDLRLSYVIGTPGTYFVRVRDSGDNNESTMPYTLTLLGADFQSFAPVARIDSIDPGAIVVGDSVNFNGSGSDIDGTLARYSWRSSIDGLLSEQASFITSELTIGTHDIYFRVRDNEGIWSTEVNELVYVGSSVSEEIEDNGSFFGANEFALDRPLTGKTDWVNDHDFYKTYVPAAGRLVFELTNVPVNLRMEMALYNRYWDWLSIYNSATTSGDNVSVIMDVVEPGFVYIRIRDLGGQLNEEFTYTLASYFTKVPDVFEPNGGTLHTGVMPGPVVRGYFYPANEEDWFRIWVDAGSMFSAKISSVPADIRPEIVLYGRNREWLSLYHTAVNAGDLVSTQFEVGETGFYYIRVRAMNGGSNWIEPYTLTVSGAVPGFTPVSSPLTAEVESNDQIADGNMVVLGTSFQGAIGPDGDLDWMTFQMPTPGVLHLSVSDIPAAFRGRLQLFRDNMQHLGTRQATNSGDSLFLDVRLSDPGVYHLRLDHIGAGLSSAQPYTLGLTATSIDDVFEPNNRFQDATVMSEQNRVQGYLFDVGEVDWYQVRCKEGDTLRVTVGDVPSELRPQIEIYNEHAQHQATKRASNDGQTITLEYGVPSDGEYHIRILDVGNNSYSAQPYTLLIDGATFESYVPMAFLDTMTPNPAGEGEVVVLGGHGEDADGSIIGYRWRSSIDDVFSVSQNASSEGLSTGVHTIYFQVKDNDQNWSPEASAILFYGVPAPQESEPNNIVGSASLMEIGRQYQGKMDTQGDMDWFRIPVPQPGMLTIEAVNPSAIGIRFELAMYTPDVDWASVYTSASNSGDSVTLRWDLSVGGDYFLRLRNLDNLPEGEYTVTATLDAVEDPFEPNQDFTRAAPIEINDSLDAFIFPRGEEDWYEVNFSTPGAFHTSLTSVPENLKMEIVIYGSNLNWLSVYTFAGNPGDNVFLDYDIPAPGTYFIRIRDMQNTRNIEGAYTFTTSFEPVVDVFEPNPDVWRAKLVTQSPVQAYIFPRGDQDFYQLFVSTEGSLDIMADQVPENMRIELVLYDANYSWMALFNTSPSKGEPVLLQRNLGVGYYYLRVRDVDNGRSPVQPYRLTVTGADLNHVVPTELSDIEHEPNDVLSQATLVRSGGFSGLYDATEDWYRFDVSYPVELIMTLTSPSSNRSRMELFNQNAGRLAGRDAENKGDVSEMVYLITDPGAYFLRISDQNAATSEQPYQVTLTMSADPDVHEPNPSYSTASELPLNTPVQANVFPRGDHDWYWFQINEPGTVQFNVLGQAPNIATSIHVFNENLQQLLGKEVLNTGDPLESSLRIPTPGLYWLRVRDRRDNVYTLQSYTVSANFIPVADANEPNDRYRDATPIVDQNQVLGLIHPNNDWDWYRFTVDQPQQIRIQVSQPDGIRPDVRLFNDSKTQLAGMYARNFGETITMVYDITQPDDYFVTVSAAAESGSSKEPYALTIEGAQVKEMFPMTEPFMIMQSNPAQVGEPIILTGQGTDGSGAVVRYEWTSNLAGLLGDTASVQVANLAPGLHTIGLRVQDDVGHWSGRVDQSLIVAPEIVFESEYNNSVETAYPVPLNTWVVGQSAPNSDHDFYQIYVEQCGLVRILVDAVPSTMRSEIAMYNSDGGWMSISSSAVNDGEWVDVSFNAMPGYYHIRIRDIDSQWQSGTYALKVFFDPAGDRLEPNASFAQAVLIPTEGVLDDLTICPRGDEDWFRFDIEQPGRLSMQLSSLPPGMRGEIVVYDANFGWLSVYNSAFHNGEVVTLDYDAVSTGIFYIRIRDLNNAGHTEPYTFQSQFVPVPDPYEPNHGHGVATLLEQGTMEAYIFRGGDEDWYRVYAGQDTQLQFSVTQVPRAMRPEIVLYGTERQWLSVYETANNSGDEVFLSYTIPASGIYYIRIRDLNNQSHLEPYRFTIDGGAQFGFEPDFAPITVEQEDNSGWVTANDVAFDTNITATTSPNNDSDQFRFWVNAPGIVHVAHTQVAEELTSEMWVFEKHLGQIGYRTTTNPGEDNLMELAIISPGWYYIRIRDRGNNNMSEEPYTLRLTHIPVIDDHEPNGGLGQATPLGQSTIQGYLFNGTDVDWYRVYAREPGLLSVSLDDVPEANRPRLNIYDSNGANRGNWVNTNPGVGGENVLTYNATSSGFYYVRVNDEANQYSSEPYTLRIEGADFSLAPILDLVGDRVIGATIPYAMRLSARDPDNPHALTYAASNLPPGASFDPVTRLFEWTPLTRQAGEYPGVTFEVSDGSFTDNESINITVVSHNLAPVLEPIGWQRILVEAEFRLHLDASDPNAGGVLSFSADKLPSGAVFDAESATFFWTPEANQLGVHSNILFVVTDGERSDFEYITIEVVDELTPLDPREVWWNKHFTEAELLDPEISGEQADPDGDTMTNAQELEADTDPRDASSLLRIVRLVLLQDGVEIHWVGGIEANQFLEKRVLLNGSKLWEIIYSEKAPTPLENAVKDEFAGEGSGYYRIRAERP